MIETATSEKNHIILEKFINQYSWLKEVNFHEMFIQNSNETLKNIIQGNLSPSQKIEKISQLAMTELNSQKEYIPYFSRIEEKKEFLVTAALLQTIVSSSPEEVQIKTVDLCKQVKLKNDDMSPKWKEFMQEITSPIPTTSQGSSNLKLDK